MLRARGFQLNIQRQRLVGPCPVHGGDNPTAFVVHRSRNLWFCFSRCAAGGNVIDLVCRLDRTDYQGAAASLAALAGSPQVPSRPTTRSPEPPFRPYTRALHLDPNAEPLRGKGIRPETARRFEVGLYRGHRRAFLHGCIGVRLHDPDGQPLGYAGRRLHPGEAHALGKWKMPPGLPKRRILYNLHRVRDDLASTGVVIVEGPWGVLRLAQLHVPAIALLGTHLSNDHARLLETARRVIVMLDADPAGRLAADRVGQRLRDSFSVQLPEGCDPDDLLDPALRALLQPFFSS
ncbi:MAG: toprim domain-containing protein [bacterium]|nr:toprim domain-containing protein [bacterium]